jgi:hypothetical protein
MRLIGFAGPAGSGKDTCVKHLVEQYGFEHLSFGRPLYKALDAMGFGWPKTQEEKEAIHPLLGCSWRHMAQTLGTEWGRALIHDDIWVIAALSNLKEDGSYVLSDTRFENEARRIRDMGGLVVHLTGRKDPMTEATRGHASEKGLARDMRDFFVTNGGSLKDLYETLDCMLAGPWSEHFG